MRWPQPSDLSLRSRVFASAFVLLALLLCLPARALAQPVITSGTNYGTYPIGDVELPLAATGGSGSYSWSIVGGAPPAGLSIRHDVPSYFPPGATTGLIGVATTPGTYSFTVRVSDGASSAQQNVTVTITEFVIQTPYNLPDGFDGAPYSCQLAVTGYPNGATLTWAPNGAMPPGLSLASNGVLSGTPTSPGFYTVSYSVGDGTDTIYWNHNLFVSEVQIPTDGLLPIATLNQSYTQTITGSGGTGGYTFMAGGLPNGLAFNGGTISGAPTQQGRWVLNITATDSSNNSYSKTFTLFVINPPPPLPVVEPYANLLDDCSLGVQCNRGIGNWSGQPPFSWSVSGQPDGMSIRSGSGVASSWITPGDAELWGTPSVAGDYAVTVTVMDATGASATNTFPLHISALWQTNGLPNGTMNMPYSASLRVVGGSGAYTAALTGGSLPRGVTLDAVHLTIGGTPLEGGPFSPQFTFDDGSGNGLTVTTYNVFIANVGNTVPTSIGIDTVDLGTATLNAPWSFAISACCRPSYAWSVENGSSLPPGLSLSSGGLLSGTPTVAGQYAFTVRAADASNSSDYSVRQLSLRVTPVFTTSSTLPYGNVSVPYSQQLQAAGGTGPYTWTLAPGSFLPPGLSLTSNGLLAGAPSATGLFQFTVNIVDVVTLNTATGFYSMSVYPFGSHPPLSIVTNGNFGTFSVGDVEMALVAQDGTGNYTWSLVGGTLPPGMAVRPDGAAWFPSNASGGVIGIATVPGAYSFTLRVSDGAETRDLASTMTIAPITPKDWNLPDGFLKMAYSYTLAPLGNIGPAAWSSVSCGSPLCDLPPGLTLNSLTGILSGTPTTPGYYNFQITMTADGFTVWRTLNIGIYAIQVDTSTPLVGGVDGELPSAMQGQPYSATIIASGGTGSYTFSTTSLPNGLTLNPTTGVISGTYNGGQGKYQISITATDTSAVSYSKTVSIQGVATPAVLPTVAPYGQRFDDCPLGVGWACSRGISAASGAAAPFTWAATGLPLGMSIRFGGASGTPSTYIAPGDAEIWGTPTELGTFNVTVTATDATGAQASNTFPLHISELELDPNSELIGGTYGAAYSRQFRVIGGQSAYSVTQFAPGPNNTLPAGMTLDGTHMIVSGSPIETGGFSPDFVFVDSASPAHVLHLHNYFFIADSGIGTIQINTSSDLGYFTASGPFSFTFSACCVPSYSWSVASGSLPPGTALNASTGVLSGTLPSGGTYTFALRVQNASDSTNFAVRQFTMVVTPEIQSTSGTLPFGNVNVFYSQQLQVSGATNPTTFALAPYSVLPAGLTLSGSGLLSGTPTGPGQFNFSVIASDSASHLLRLFLQLAIYPNGSAPPLTLNIGPNLGAFAVGQLTITLSSANTSGGTAPYHYSLSPGANVIPGMRVQDGQPLPTGFATQNPVPTAAFIGVIDTPGVYTSSIRVTDSLGHTFDKAITLTVSPLNLISASPISKAAVGVPYSFFLTAAGGSGTYHWSITNLPAGLSIDPTTGEIHGTPSSAGSSNPNVTITDLISGQQLTTGTGTLTVNAFAITTPGALPAASVGVAYSTTLTAASGCTSCAWSAPSGGLPGGLTISAAGILSGTPTFTGTTTFTLRATATGGVTVDQVFSLIVLSSPPQALTISNSATFGPNTIGGQFTNQLTATGGQPPYAWSLVSGALPPGIQLASSGATAGANLAAGVGYLYGRAIQTGTFTFTLSVTDAASATATRAFTWNISSLNLQYFTLPLRDNNNNLIGQALTRGTPYTQALLAIGGTSHYTWSGALPAGLTLDPSSGIITGTPLDSGTLNVPIAVADDGGHAFSNFTTFTIAGSFAVSFGAGITQGPFAQGATTSINLSPSGGTAPYTITALTPLPPGFAIESGSAVLANGTTSNYFLAGTPLASGLFTFTLRLQDSASNSTERTFTVTVSPISVFTVSPLTDGSVNAPYSAQLVAFDGAGATTFSVAPGSALPAGLTLSPGGLLSGTPTSAGSYSFNASISDATGIVLSWNFSLKISPLAIAGPSILPTATVLQPYSYSFAATGATGGVSWSFQNSALPSGLSVSPSGVLSGTPIGASSGSFVQITATATNNGNSVSRRFSLFVRAVNLAPPSFALTQQSLPDGNVGQSYSFSLNPTGGLAPYTWSVAAASSLPPGLSLLTGAQLPSSAFPGATFIGGQPTVAGPYSFDLILADANGAQTQRTFSLNVSAISILSGNLRNVTAGQPYAEQLTAVGGAGPYTFSASLPVASPTAELLPPGITLSSSGLLSGTTNSTGVYTLVIQAQDALGNTFTRTYQLTASNASGLRVTSGNYGDSPVGYGLSQDLFTNGNSSYTWSVSGGALPVGLFFGPDPDQPSTTMLTGQPSVPGQYSYTLRATDNANGSNFADHTFSLNITPIQMIAPPPLHNELPGAQVGAPYSVTIAAAGGTAPYTFSPSAAGPIPPGLTLGADGTLSGTPTAAGVYAVAVVISDQAGHTHHLTFSVFVTATGTPDPMSAVSNDQLMDDASVGAPYRFALMEQRGGVAPFSWSVAAESTLPPGLAIVAGGNGVPDYLAGVPTTPGAYTFALTVTDAIGETVSPAFALNVSTLTLTPSEAAPGFVGVPYSLTLAPLGGVGPYAIQALPYWDMPPGLSLSASGVLSGTPTSAGGFAVRVLVTDSASATLSKLLLIAVDNAAGEAPTVRMAPRAIQLSYTQTFADPGPIAVGITTTSGTPAYTLAVEGIPGATLASAAGSAPGGTSVDLHVTTLGTGTYAGVLALSAPGSSLLVDSIPITVTVASVPPCTYTVSPGSTTMGAGAGGGSFALATSGACSWSAAVSDPWIALTSGASGTGAATIAYSVAANAGAAQRSGTISINGSVYTITQFGSACSFAINPAGLSAPASGGIASISVVASDSSCAWNASDLGASPASGMGNGTVTVTIPPNTNPGSQVLTATIAGQPFTVIESGIDCTVAISPSMASFADAGGIGTASITTAAACSYSTTSSPSWISLDSGSTGIGSGALHYTVSANSATTPRTGSVAIGGQTLTISQGAAACSVTLDTTLLGSPFGAGAGSGVIGVMTNGSNCAWSVSSNANWVTFAPNASSGNGSVNIGIAANPSTLSRSASVSIGGQSVTIAQSGQACSYALQSSTGTVPASGGSGSVGVLTPAACSWNPVSSDPSWLSAGGGAAGSGSAVFVAAVNPDPSPRTATLTIAGLTFTVTQPAAACTFSLDATSISVSGDGAASTSFAVGSGSPSCAPAPVSYANWITSVSTSFAGTSGTVSYTVQPNPYPSPRSGVIQIGDQSFTVTQGLAQSSCLYSLHAYGAAFNRGGGGGDVFGSPSALGCDPTATIGTDQPSFIALLPLSGPVNDIFTEPYSVAPFDTPLTAVIRLGRITFGGQLFVVKQVSW